MTPVEASEKLRAFLKAIGPNADAGLSVTGKRYSTAALSFTLWPDGVCKETAFSVEADTFDELFALAEAAWAKRQADYRAKIIRSMALEIIRLTADHGECTDAALRATFSVEEVARFGKEAVKDANAIASNGPFAIAIMKGANAA